MPEKLYDATLRMLRETNVPLDKIARELDPKPSLRWLFKIRSGDVKNPGVVSIQNLHDYLKKCRVTQ